MADEARGSVLSGMFWMFIVSLLLFWLPGLGALIAGIVGGMKAGGIIAAMTAALLPGMVFGVGLFFLATLLTGLPVVGAVAAMGGLALALLHIGPLLAGAIVGGIIG